MDWSKAVIVVLAAAVVLPQAAALDLNSTTSLRYFPDSEMEFAVTPEGNLNMTGDNITNFFNQTQCQENYVVSGVYSNGSYECVSANSAVSAQDLETTLGTGSSAGPYSINMNENSINNIYSLSGADGSVRFNSDLDLGDNQLIVGNSSISGGLKIGSDINLQGNDLRQIGFINPSGASTNFGGDLNVGNERLTSVDNMEFARGIEIGNEDTYTGQRDVSPPSSFTVDTGQEWNDNGTVVNNLAVGGSSLELGKAEDTAQHVWSNSVSSEVDAVRVANNNVYAAVGDNLRKYSEDGGLIWKENLPSNVPYEGLSVDNNVIFAVAGDKLYKYQDNGGSVSQIWNKTLPKQPKSLEMDSGSLYIAAVNLTAKYDSSGSMVWNKSISFTPFDIDVSGDSIYVTKSPDGGSALRKIEEDGDSASLSWSISSTGGEYIDIEGDTIYVAETSGYLTKYVDNGGSVSKKYSRNIGSKESVYFTDGGGIVADGTDIYISGSIGSTLWKYSDDGSSFSPEWSVGIEESGAGDLAFSENNIYVGGQYSSDGTVEKVENIIQFHESGSYNSDVFDSGSENQFPDFEVSSFLPSGTGVNVTVELSNSSDMSGSVSRRLEVGGGTESQLIGERARYAQFTVNMTGDSTDTPELNRVTINYGNAAAAYGYNQIALGQSATTDAPGAVAIGHNASSNESYTVRFGNSQGQELDVEVTGNLSVDGSAAFGNNTNSGLESGDLNASDIYYDTLTAKSPVVQCSAGSDWCKVDVPENQSSFFVKKSEGFDKDRPRKTAAEVVESDVETVEELEELRKENERQEERLRELNRTVQGLKSVVCEDNPGATVCS